ncbi:MAG: hypothetical protein Q4D06_02370 [Coriobacteriia bacterium]|nr:hypothetical protein [Coriobacteriia bacterium]
MITTNSSVALGQLGDTIYLLMDRDGQRPHLYDEDGCEDSPFIKLINSSNLSELMSAADEIHSMLGPSVDFIDDRGGFQIPKKIKNDQSPYIASLFEENPPEKALKKTEEAIKIWSIAKIGPGVHAQHDLKKFGAESFTAVPLADVITAVTDLRRHCLLFAWLVGKTAFENAHGLTPMDKSLKYRGLNLEGDSDLSEYYRKLCDAPANKWTRFTIEFGSFEMMHLCEPIQIERDVTNYVRSVFSILMSDTTTKLDGLLQPTTTPNTVVSAAWTFFGKGISKLSGPGAISVCEHCGKFYESRRSTKRFCSDSCRVLAKRKPKSTENQPYVTTIAKERMRLRDSAKSLPAHP